MPEFTFRGQKYNNPVELSLDIIGGKWKMPVIWRLKDKTMRYSEIRKSLPAITHKMLTQQLRELENDGIIERKVYPVVPPKVEYSLTRLGHTIVPIIEGLREWGSFFRSQFND